MRNTCSPKTDAGAWGPETRTLEQLVKLHNSGAMDNFRRAKEILG